MEQYAESGISTDCDIAAMVRRNSSMLNHISSLLSLEERGLGTRLFTPITSSSPPPPPSRSSFFSSFASSPPLSTAGCTSLQCSACIWRRAIQRGEVTNQLLLALSLIASLKVRTCKFNSFHYIVFFSFLLSIRTRNHTAKHLRSCFSRCISGEADVGGFPPAKKRK